MIQVQDLSLDVKENLAVSFCSHQQQYPIVNIQSNFVEDYHRLIREVQFQPIDMDELTVSLLQEDIKYSRENVKQQLHIVLEEYSSNYEALKINVSYGYFCTSLYVINIDSIKQFKNTSQSFVGAFGSIEKYYIDDNSYAVKSVKFQEDNFINVFRQVVKQYFLLKIASALRVGPSATSIFGFNIIAFRNCLDISMQFCQGTSRKDIPLILKRNLSILHYFNIVHMDIKPENISFSQRYNDYVFIDFGLSRAIKENIGEKSYTKFTGSFIYCCNEMLDLYTKETIGLVDLYYNDAFCLNQTLKKSEAKPQELNIDKHLIEEKRQFWKDQKHLFYKYELFTQACQAKQQISFEKLASFIIHPELQNFILNLPQQLNIRQYYKSILTKKYQYEEKTMDSQIQPNQLIIDHSQMFSQRFNHLKNANKVLANNDQERLQQMLIDGQSLKETRFGLYCLSLIKFIKMNGSDNSFERKVLACRTYSEFCLKEQFFESDNILYRKVVQSIFETALSSNQPEGQQILRNAIETVAILELVSEDIFIQAYFAVFEKDFKFVQTVRLAFQFITVLQFIREKNNTQYNYKRLQKIFINRLGKFVEQSDCQQRHYAQKSIIQKIRVIIFRLEHHILTLNFIEIINHLRQGRQYTVQQKRVNEDLKAFIVYLDIKQTVNQYYLYTPNQIAEIELWINRFSQYSNKFTYLHLILFKVYCATSQLSAAHKIYIRYYKQFKDYKQMSQLSIYVLNKINLLKSIFSRISMPISDQKVVKRPDTQQLEDIFHDLNKSIKNSRICSDYLSQIFYIPNLVSDQICSKYLFDMVARNISMITKPLDQAQLKVNHTNNFKRKILLLNNLTQFISMYEELYSSAQHIQQSIDKSLSQYKQFIDNSTCLQCKIYGILQIQLTAKRNAQLKMQFQKLIDFLILVLKHKELVSSIIPIMIMMIRICKANRQISTKYQMLDLFYQYIKHNRKLSLCLTNVGESNIFVNLFLRIQIGYPFEETVYFVYELTKSLQQRKSAVQIDQFYYSMIDIVKVSEHHFYGSFKQFNNQVFRGLIRDYNIRSNPYLCLYFIAVLQIKIRSAYQKFVLRKICLSLNFLDSYSKKIILNRYYFLYSFFQNHSERKNAFLKRKHFRNTFNKVPLKFLLKSKIKSLRGREKKQRKIKANFKRFIEVYHQNLGNLK